MVVDEAVVDLVGQMCIDQIADVVAVRLVEDEHHLMD